MAVGRLFNPQHDITYIVNYISEVPRAVARLKRVVMVVTDNDNYVK